MTNGSLLRALRGMECTTIGNERFVATRCGGICILEACQAIEARDLTKPLPKLKIKIETNAETISNPNHYSTVYQLTVTDCPLPGSLFPDCAAGIKSLIVHSKLATLLFLKELTPLDKRSSQCHKSILVTPLKSCVEV